MADVPPPEVRRSRPVSARSVAAPHRMPPPAGPLPRCRIARWRQRDQRCRKPSGIVDFSYDFRAGTVYYSTIPLDFYLGAVATTLQLTSSARSTWRVNEVAFEASLSTCLARRRSVWRESGSWCWRPVSSASASPGGVLKARAPQRVRKRAKGRGSGRELVRRPPVGRNHVTACITKVARCAPPGRRGRLSCR
jgi:hypothetical protein